MDNFFASNKNKPEDNSLKAQYDDIKDNYQQIFIEAAESIRREINEFKPENPCDTCALKKDCKIEKTDVFTKYPNNCKYRDWQLQILTFLAGDYRQKLKIIHKNILEKRTKYACNQCGACCKLAVSEYSYAQLKQRASKGDKFAEEFTSVFIPYEKDEDAKAANPEYFKLLEDTMQDVKVYFYHCPKVKDNLCSDYGNRPDICKDYPYNPLMLLPCECSYNEWKNEVAHEALLLKAKVDIIAYYKKQLS